jgi:hypothetical protein
LIYIIFEKGGQLLLFMPNTNSTDLQFKLKQWSGYLSVAVIVIGFLVLLGWEFDLEFLKHPFPGFVAMNPLTAILFILSGFCLKQSLKFKEENRPTLALLLSLIIIATSAFIFAGVAFGFDPVIDTLLFSSSLKNDVINNIPNRMAPNTAVNFLLAGIALLLNNSRADKKKNVSQVLAAIIFFIGMLSLLGYLYKVDKFYGIMKFIPMAIQTAICFILVSISILFLFPDRGILRHLTGQYSGSTSARFLVPAAVIIPATLGYFRILGQWSYIYSSEFGVAILVLSIIIIMLALIWYNAASLNKRDELREKAEARTK